MASVDRGKMKSAIAYIAARTRTGKVKLFKLLYLADFSARARLGESITGDVYENFEMGPVPVTLWREFASIISECATIEQVDTGAIPEQRIIPRQNVANRLSLEETKILDEVLHRFGQMSGNQLRDYTHSTLPYRASKRGDTIPYGLAAYVNYRRPSRQDVDQLLRDESLLNELRAALKSAA